MNVPPGTFTVVVTDETHGGSSLVQFGQAAVDGLHVAPCPPRARHKDGRKKTSVIARISCFMIYHHGFAALYPETIAYFVTLVFSFAGIVNDE